MFQLPDNLCTFHSIFASPQKIYTICFQLLLDMLLKQLLHISVPSNLLEKWQLLDMLLKQLLHISVPSNLLEKWQLLDMLLRQLLHTGRMLSRVGNAREARCYLQQGV